MMAPSVKDDEELLAQVKQILEEHEKKPHGAVSRKDIINCNAFWGIRKLLPHNLEIKASSADFFSPIVPTYCIEGCIHISKVWYWTELYASPGYPSDYSPGSWRCRPSNGHPFMSGPDMISLLTGLHSGALLKAFAADLDADQIQTFAALCKEGASEETALADIIRKLEIDPEHSMLKMRSIPSGWMQSDWAYPSMRKLEGATPMNRDPKVNTSPDLLPFLRRPSATFGIYDEQDHLQAILASWETFGKGTAMASFVPCHREDDPSKQRWMIAKSTRKLSPFGLEAVAACPEAKVIVDDDLNVVDGVNKKLRARFTNPPMALVGWPKKLFGATPKDTDWNALRGRKIVFAVSNDAEFFKHGLDFGLEINAIETESLEFALPKEWPDGHETLKIDSEAGHLEAELVSWQRFQEIAIDRFGLSVRNGASVGTSAGWKLGDPLPDGAGLPGYLLEPVISKGSAVLLYSAPGVGKSWLALLISYAIGCGTKILGGRWRGKSQHNCLYISTEMTTQVISRLRTIDQSLGCQEAKANITVYPHPGSPHRAINLEEEKTWDELSGMIAAADFIVIDHLSNVTKGNNDIGSWKRLWHFIEPLRQSGKTFLILHHAGKTGTQRGTSVLEADVDMVIRMECLPDVENGALISFDKYRDDESLGKAFSSFKLLWDQGDEPGTFRWQVEDLETGERVKEYVSLGGRPPQIDQEALEAKYGKGRIASIVRCLAEASLRGERGLSTGSIVKGVGCSAGTVRSEIKSPLDRGEVIRSGMGKATCYSLSEETLNAVTSR